MSQERVHITIDGRTVEVPKGMLLVEAAKLAGVDIPVFCHHPKLEPVGVCRMCLVEVEGQRKPVTACTMPVSDGMVVRTQTELIDQLRKGVLELLLLNHPLDCPVCDKGGECPLQDQTYSYGPAVSRSLDPKVRKLKSAELGNFIVFDRERCIVCRRCTRFDDEIALENNLVVAERADGVVITTAPGERYDSYFSGNTIELCPVGALTSELYRFRARPWDLAKVPSVCTGCSVGCNVRLDYRFGELVRVVSRENPAVDGGWLCDRGRFNYGFVQGEGRVERPLVRMNGKLQPVSWDQALNIVAERLNAVRQGAGPQAIGFIGGGRLTNEEAYLLGKLARAGLGTANIDYRTGRQLVASYGPYAGRMVDVDSADTVLIVDTLVQERAPVLDLRVRKCARRGGRIISVGAVHGAYRVPVKRYDALPGQVGEALGGAQLLDDLSAGDKIIVLWAGHDAAIGRALDGLLAQLREMGKDVRLLILSEQGNGRGAEWMGLHPALLPGGRVAAEASARAEVEQAWGAALPAEDGLSTESMLKAAAAGSLEALVLFGANLKQTYPDGELVAAALQKAFVVAVDLFVTETAEYADVILPAAAFPAKAGAYTTLDGQVQKVQPADYPEFETWTDGQIITALAERLRVNVYASDEALAEEMARLGCTASGFAGLTADAFAAALEGGLAASSAAGEDLVLVPVERLFAGGGTSYFDRGIEHARPRAEALLNPEDASEQGVAEGDTVTLTAGGVELELTVRVSAHVVPGTVQVVAGLPGTDAYALLQAGEHPRVRLHRSVMEEVG